LFNNLLLGLFKVNKTNNTINNKINNKTNNTTNTSGTRNTTLDNTISGATIPAAGAKALVVPAIILILGAYVFYNKYMKYKDI
jgi:hypothetical protein